MKKNILKRNGYYCDCFYSDINNTKIVNSVLCDKNCDEKCTKDCEKCGSKKNKADMRKEVNRGCCRKLTAK
jgi:hypothetical protein